MASAALTNDLQSAITGSSAFNVTAPKFSKTTRIAVLCGGLSSEREVSLRSGQNCLEALHRLGYENAQKIDVDRHIAATLVSEKIEVVFLALHGRYGEDGSIQGMLELLGIPYTGNGLKASAMTMDKAITKIQLQAAGLPVLPSTVLQFHAGQQQGLASVQYNGSYPVMVKPIGEGSSVGMSKVEDPSTLDAAVEIAVRYSSTVLLEPFIPGKDLTVGIIEVNGEPVVTPILELRPKQGWYDEKAKYTAGLTDFILPAELSPELTEAVQQTTLHAHQALGCRGVSRTDFVMDGEGRFYILEINTIPGMTDLSDLPAQARAMGMGYDQLVHHLLQSATLD